MTTIACNRTQMAGDTMMAVDGLRGRLNKLHKIGGKVAGYAGGVTDGLSWIKWLRTKCDVDAEPKMETGSVVGLVLGPKGIELWEDCEGPVLLLDDFYAIGEGAGVAIAAMRDGKSPKNAVLAAAAVYVNTGTEIKVLRLRK